MRRLMCAIAAVGLLSACADEAEVVEEDVGVAADTAVNDTAMAPATVGTWDVNSDDQFQQAEYSTIGDSFGTWDADADGLLTNDEFNAGWTNAGWDNGEGAFTAFDDNSDGALGEDEFFSDGQWGEWDANSDGVLDNNEWTY